MRILALETSSSVGSLALMEDAQPRLRLTFPPARKTARTFATCLDRALRTAGWSSHHIDLVAVTRGPGSFTGLRIGITAAKTFAYATDSEILGIDTLAAIAAQSGHVGTLTVILDAQRQQLFFAEFDTTSGSPVPVGETQIVSKAEFVSQRRAEEFVTGSGLAKLRDDLPSHMTVIDERAWSPRAETIARLALADYQAGRRDDLWKLVPVYLRQSAAEEKLVGNADDGTKPN